MAKCFRCGKALQKIDYCEPDWEGLCPLVRPPLCKKCWQIRDKEETEKHSTLTNK